jgi:hypothetical protein
MHPIPGRLKKNPAKLHFTKSSAFMHFTLQQPGHKRHFTTNVQNTGDRKIQLTERQNALLVADHTAGAQASECPRTPRGDRFERENAGQDRGYRALPTILEGELLISWVHRTLLILGVPSVRIHRFVAAGTMQKAAYQLFELKSLKGVHVPEKLIGWCSIFSHTTAQYFLRRPWNRQYLALTPLERFCITKIDLPAGPAVFRYCPACARSDSRTCGIPLVYGAHQLPNVEVCWRHRAVLCEAKKMITNVEELTIKKQSATMLQVRMAILSKQASDGREMLIADGQHGKHPFKPTLDRLSDAFRDDLLQRFRIPNMCCLRIRHAVDAIVQNRHLDVSTEELVLFVSLIRTRGTRLFAEY